VGDGSDVIDILASSPAGGVESWETGLRGGCLVFLASSTSSRRFSCARPRFRNHHPLHPGNGRALLIADSEIADGEVDQADPAAVDDPYGVTAAFAAASTAGGRWLAKGHAL
jgi:hypothetical protein